MDNHSSIGAKVKQYRELRDLSRAELGRCSKRSEVAIWMIETGKTKHPKSDTLLAIASALDIPVALLFS